MKAHLWQKILFSAIGLVLLILFTACSGVGGTGSSTPTPCVVPGTATTGTITLSGTITAVNPQSRTVTLNVCGQTYNVSGLNDQQIQALTGQVGHTYTFTVNVTKNPDGSYTITPNTQPTPGEEGSPEPSGTPEPSETPNGTETPSAGQISFTGPIQSVSSNSIVVNLPDNTPVTMTINSQTDQSELNGTQLSSGQKVKIEAVALSDGSLAATKIKSADNGDDTSQVHFTGKTTQAVGSDNVLHFSVGNQNYSYTISSNPELKGFTSAQSIASGTQVEVTVQFNGTTGSVIEIKNPNS